MNEWMNEWMHEWMNEWRLFICYWIFFCLELSLNTCLQMTYRKTAMETRNERTGQDGREHGWCSSKYPQGVAKAYLSFFYAYVFQNMIHSKAQRKRWPHAAQQKAAGWGRNLMQCFQIQSKWMRRPDTQNFNWHFLHFFYSVLNVSEIGTSMWKPRFKLHKHSTALSTKSKLQN